MLSARVIANLKPSMGTLYMYFGIEVINFCTRCAAAIYFLHLSLLYLSVMPTLKFKITESDSADHGNAPNYLEDHKRVLNA